MLHYLSSLQSSVAGTSQVTEIKEKTDAALTFYNKEKKQSKNHDPQTSLLQTSAETLAYLHRATDEPTSASPVNPSRGTAWYPLHLKCALTQRGTEAKGDGGTKAGMDTQGGHGATLSGIHKLLQLLSSLHSEAPQAYQPCTASVRPAGQDPQVSIPPQEAQYPPGGS